jgi:hypothetical protein
VSRSFGSAIDRASTMIDATQNAPLDQAGLAGVWKCSWRCGSTLKEFLLFRKREQSEKAI